MAGHASEAVWVEKYRPTSLKDMVGQEAIIPLLRAYAEKRSMPHLLFAGPPGSGKTTAALALARDLYGSEWRQNFLEMNASVTGDTPVMIRTHGRIERTTMGTLAARFFRSTEGDSVATPGLEALSLDRNHRVCFRPVSSMSRHRVPAVARVAVEGGTLGVSLNHSVMTVGEDGRLTPRAVRDLVPGDLLLSFTTVLAGRSPELDLSGFAPKQLACLPNGSAPYRRPTVEAVRNSVSLDTELSGRFGDYAAEAGASPSTTSGNVVSTHAFPGELAETFRAAGTLARYGVRTRPHLTRSGFDSKDASHRLSAIQSGWCSVPWMRFFRESFYVAGTQKNARSKDVLSSLFGAPVAERHAFLRGYSADPDGGWGAHLRYTSRSESLLIDVAWLARISGLESSHKSGWGHTILFGPHRSTLRRPDLIPAEPFSRFVRGLDATAVRGNWRHLLRHTLYHQRRPRALKQTVRTVLDRVDEERLTPHDRAGVGRWRALADSDLHSLRILSIRVEESPQEVYDLAVPEGQMFWGGTIPLLLHNSDERGIDTVRTSIKQYARTAPLGEVGFKLLFLDEADNLTAEAQAALRRMMERYSASCRFILSCNYSSRIIDPIQSRCAVFRFRAYSPEAVRTQVNRVAAAERKKVSPEAMEAILSASGGDMRRATNLLQLASAHTDTISGDTIKEYATIPLRREVEGMFSAALHGNFREARDRLFALFVERGASGEDILRAIHSYLPDIPENILSAREKVRLLEYLGEVDFRLAQGASDRIQLEAVLAHVAAGSAKGE